MPCRFAGYIIHMSVDIRPRPLKPAIASLLPIDPAQPLLAQPVEEQQAGRPLHTVRGHAEIVERSVVRDLLVRHHKSFQLKIFIVCLPDYYFEEMCWNRDIVLTI